MAISGTVVYTGEKIEPIPDESAPGREHGGRSPRLPKHRREGRVLVHEAFASWNQIAGCLRRLDALRATAQPGLTLA